MKRIITLLLLGMMLPAMPLVATAQSENPTSQQMEAISREIEADAALQVERLKAQAGTEIPPATEALSPEAKRAAHLAAMEHWPMKKKLMLGVKLLFLGMAVVMGVLILIALVTAFLNNQEIKHEEEIERRVQAALKAKGTVAPVAATAATASDVNGATVAAIAAAVTVALRGHRFRIKSLKLASNAGSAWSQHGRQTIMASHSLERKSQ